MNQFKISFDCRSQQRSFPSTEGTSLVFVTETQYKESGVEGCCATFAGGTAVSVVWTHYVQWHILEGLNLHQHCCQNVRSCGDAELNS